MTIYEKLAKMSNQQINAVWRALKDYDPTEDSQWYDSTENISMDDWMQAVYSEMDRRGIPHTEQQPLCCWQSEHPTGNIIGTIQCPKCKQWFCAECAETFLDFAMLFGQKAVLPKPICAQCHYQTFGRK